MIPVDQWLKKIQACKLSRFSEKLLMQSQIANHGDYYRITIDKSHRGILDKKRAAEIRASLNMSKDISFGLSKETLTNTPDQYILSKQYAENQQVLEDINSDPIVQMLKKNFNAKVIKVEKIWNKT